MTEINWLSAAEVSQAFTERRLSPVELLQTLLNRIRSLDSKLNTFVCLDADMAMAQARVAEHEIFHGRSRGPLHGMPIGIKDIIDVAGLPTTCQSKLLLDNIAHVDAGAVRRLREAGLIVLGKLATWEFAIGGPSYDLPFPPAQNPWKNGHQPGGSSSGSGAGLAAGLFPLALGTDSGGSVRNPSAACGVVGIKPTYGLVSRLGVFPLSFTLDHVGPMARSVGDAAMLLDVIAGHEPSEPSSVAVPRHKYHSELNRGIQGLRVGFVRNFHEEVAGTDPEVAAALDKAVTVFREAGANIVDVNLPALQDFSSVFAVILHSEAWSVHAPWLRTRAHDYGQMARQKLMNGAFLTAGDYVAAQRRRTQLIARVDNVFRDVDIMLAANALEPARSLSEHAPWSALAPRMPFNVTGHPAIAIMSGLSHAGLPLSMQLIGRNFDEGLLFRAAAIYERATSWHAMRPPI